MKIGYFFKSLLFFLLLQNTLLFGQINNSLLGTSDKPKMTRAIYEADKNKDHSEQSKIQNGEDSLLNSLAVDFKFATIEGDTFRLSEHKGKVIFLNIFFTMCGPCLHEMRDIRDLANHYKDSKNVVVVSVSLQDTKADILKTAETYAPGFEKNLIIIPASILGNLFDGYQKTTNSSFKNATKEFFKRQYKISSVPVSLIIDKEGIVRVVLSGFDKKYEHLDFYRSETENVLMKKNR